MSALKKNISELTVLFLLLILWFFIDDILYDFIIAAILSFFIIFIFFKCIASFFIKGQRLYIVILILYLTTFSFMQEDFKLANVNVLEKIEKNKHLFSSCCHKKICEELGQEWKLIENGLMRTEVKGWGASIILLYDRKKDHYIIETKYLLTRKYYASFKCKN